MRTSSRRVGALLAALALTATACGGDDDAAAVTSLEDLSGQALGVQADTTGEAYAEENAPDDTEITSFENPGDLFTALQANQIAAVLQDLPVNEAFAENNEGFEIVEEYDTDESYGLAMALDNEPLRDGVNEALQAVRDDGTYDRIFAKYFDVDADPDEELDLSGDSTTFDASGIDTLTEGELLVCSDIPYPPFEFEGDDGEFTGFDIELVRAIGMRLDLQVEVIALGFDPIASGTALNAGQCDLAASAITITEERAESLLFSDPYYDATQSLLAPVS
jgi:ABC-type amino acid transport substrate-binding protein